MLKKEHAVAVTEKSIPLLHRVGIRGQHLLSTQFPSSKGAHQHQQGGLGEVKVGEEATDNLKFMAWSDEDAGLA